MLDKWHRNPGPSEVKHCVHAESATELPTKPTKDDNEDNTTVIEGETADRLAGKPWYTHNRSRRKNPSESLNGRKQMPPASVDNATRPNVQLRSTEGWKKPGVPYSTLNASATANAAMQSHRRGRAEMKQGV